MLAFVLEQYFGKYPESLLREILRQQAAADARWAGLKHDALLFVLSWVVLFCFYRALRELERPVQ